jgi:hypothetical protein
VSEVVFKAVSAVIRDIAVSVPFLPAGAGALRKRGGIPFGCRFAGNPTVFVRDFILFPGVYPEREVIDRRVFTADAVLKDI